VGTRDIDRRRDGVVEHEYGFRFSESSGGQGLDHQGALFLIENRSSRLTEA
jgi:hypothetical protein